MVHKTKEFVSDVNKILTAGKHLLQLINDVLDLSKIEANKMELFEETFDVASMLQVMIAPGYDSDVLEYVFMYNALECFIRGITIHWDLLDKIEVYLFKA
jgi:signal transduction histidine kinase